MLVWSGVLLPPLFCATLCTTTYIVNTISRVGWSCGDSYVRILYIHIYIYSTHRIEGWMTLQLFNVYLYSTLYLVVVWLNIWDHILASGQHSMFNAGRCQPYTSYKSKIGVFYSSICGNCRPLIYTFQYIRLAAHFLLFFYINLLAANALEY